MQLIFALHFLCVWNRMPWRNLQTVVLLQGFSRTLSMFRWVARIYEYVERFLWKLFRFLFRIFSIKKKGIINYSSYSSKSSTFVVLSDFEFTFLGERKTVTVFRFLYCFVYRLCCIISEKYDTSRCIPPDRTWHKVKSPKAD